MESARVTDAKRACGQLVPLGGDYIFFNFLFFIILSLMHVGGTDGYVSAMRAKGAAVGTCGYIFEHYQPRVQVHLKVLMTEMEMGRTQLILIFNEKEQFKLQKQFYFSFKIH